MSGKSCGMGAGRRAAACDVFSYHEEVHGGFERPEVERITKEEKDARQKRKNQNSKVYMERTFISALHCILLFSLKIPQRLSPADLLSAYFCFLLTGFLSAHFLPDTL